MITPSKERSEEECGIEVEVHVNSDISRRFLNADIDGCNDLRVYPRTPIRHVYIIPRQVSMSRDSELESTAISTHASDSATPCFHLHPRYYVTSSHGIVHIRESSESIESVSPCTTPILP
jgi:hypothetical protein